MSLVDRSTWASESTICNDTKFQIEYGVKSVVIFQRFDNSPGFCVQPIQFLSSCFGFVD